MTAALAIGYDWLYGTLDPAVRTTIKTAIIKKGLETVPADLGRRT